MPTVPRILLAVVFMTVPVYGATQESPTYETVVTGTGEAGKLLHSAEAVTVVKTDQAKHESADLGEVLARTEGVDIRRSGGLGSNVQLSLNGLTDDQVRILVDGIGLDIAGFALGVASIPLDFVERVEIYSGVVPVRFGVDALGGAVNIVTEKPHYGTGASASLQMGSFDTFRLSLTGHGTLDSGLYARGQIFFDYSGNDYPIEATYASATGQVEDVTAWRFHDHYRDILGGVEVGITDQAWADHLDLRVFASIVTSDLQNNFGMTLPYGAVTFDQIALGGMMHYRLDFLQQWSLRAIVGYGRNQTDFVDTSPWVYDWFGARVAARTIPGETDVHPHNDTVWSNSGYARGVLAWEPQPHHRVNLAVAPTLYGRHGIERLLPTPTSYDPLRAPQTLDTLVTGLDYTVTLLDAALENSVFMKDYFYSVSTDDNSQNTIDHPSLSTHQNHLGAGDMLRMRWNDVFASKVSYEYAARLPNPDEIFGDAVRVIPNPHLMPEVSHNINLMQYVESITESAGIFRGNVTGFMRLASQLILLLSNDRYGIYENVFSGRSMGIEGALHWSAPAHLVEVDLSGTWQDFRNTAATGQFASYRGDRIPNTPWLFGSSAVRLNIRDGAGAISLVSVGWYSRYVHWFYRGWESVGLASSKQTIPDQWINSLVLTSKMLLAGQTLVVTGEIDNIADAKAYDYYGVQRPGRAVFMKASFVL